MSATASAAQRRRAKFAATVSPTGSHTARRLCAQLRRALIVADEAYTAEREKRVDTEAQLRMFEVEIKRLRAENKRLRETK